MDRPYGDPGNTVNEVSTLRSGWLAVFPAYLKSLYACAPIVLRGKGRHSTRPAWAHP